MTAKNLKGVFVSDFTGGNFCGLFNNLESAVHASIFAPEIGMVSSFLLGDSESVDFAVVWARPQSILPSVAKYFDGEAVSKDQVEIEVRDFCKILDFFQERLRFCFVPTWTIPAFETIGVRSLNTPNSIANLIHHANKCLIDYFVSHPKILVLDSSRWIDPLTTKGYNPNLWYKAKVPFSFEVFQAASKDVKIGLGSLLGHDKKLIVLDLDDTLWGGIVGDDSWQSLKLGGHDAEGEAHQDFQNHLKFLKQRGVILGIASKNEEKTALEAIDNHPEMVLRRRDFAIWKINWSDKAANVREIAERLNIGLQSVVFIDDNPMERARVKESFPEIEVPEWPKNKALYSSALMNLNAFNFHAISNEDSNRTLMYQQENEREDAKTSASTQDEWLRAIGIKVNLTRLNEIDLVRAGQLLNKTNQMNLSTRRLSEKEFFDWSCGASNETWVIRVSDRFGDSGLTGIISIGFDQTSKIAEIVDFVLSCRVFGRRIEHAMLNHVLDRAKIRGMSKVVANFIPTSKNKPTLDFFSQMALGHDGSFEWEAGSKVDVGSIEITINQSDIL